MRTSTLFLKNKTHAMAENAISFTVSLISGLAEQSFSQENCLDYMLKRTKCLVQIHCFNFMHNSPKSIPSKHFHWEKNELATLLLSKLFKSNFCFDL